MAIRESKLRQTYFLVMGRGGVMKATPEKAEAEKYQAAKGGQIVKMGRG